MLDFARPGFLLAGTLLALAPPLLHLIARRPPERAPLPTARFLRPDPRTAVRLRRRPSDLLLLLLRSALALLLGAAFAAPRWVPRTAGTLELVLLDRGAAMVGAWPAAVDSARAALRGPDGGPRGVLIVFDTAATVFAGSAIPRALDSLAAVPAVAPPAAHTDYATAFRALHTAVQARSDTDAVRVALVTRPRWEGWSPGFARLRRAAWPGTVRLVVPAGDTAPGPAAPDPAGATPPPPARPHRAGILAAAAAGDGVYATAALEALEWQVGVADPASQTPDQVPVFHFVPSGNAGGADGGAGTGGAPDGVAGARGAAAAPPRPDLYLVLTPLAARAEATLLERARSGATVVVAGIEPAGALADALPWEPTAGTGPAPSAGAIVFDGGPRLDGVAARVPGEAAPGARVLAVWADGRAAATTTPLGAGCLVFLAAPLEAGRLPYSPAFPAAMGRLAAGCGGVAGRGAAGSSTRTDASGVRPAPSVATRPADVRLLDAGALAVLTGRGVPTTRSSDAGTLDAGAARAAGHPLGRWTVLAALALALVETRLAYRRRRMP